MVKREKISRIILLIKKGIIMLRRKEALLIIGVVGYISLGLSDTFLTFPAEPIVKFISYSLLCWSLFGLFDLTDANS